MVYLHLKQKIKVHNRIQGHKHCSTFLMISSIQFARNHMSDSFQNWKYNSVKYFLNSRPYFHDFNIIFMKSISILLTLNMKYDMKIGRLIQKIFNNFMKSQDLRAKTKFVAVLIGTRYNEICTSA